MFFPCLWMKSQRGPIGGPVPLNNKNSLILVKCVIQYNNKNSQLQSYIFSPPLAWACFSLDTELGRGHRWPVLSSPIFFFSSSFSLIQDQNQGPAEHRLYFCIYSFRIWNLEVPVILLC